MKNTKFPPIVFAMVMNLIFATLLNAQQSREAVILINSIPVRVELDEKGNIIRKIQEEPTSMVGYDLTTQTVIAPQPLENVTLTSTAIIQEPVAATIKKVRGYDQQEVIGSPSIVRFDGNTEQLSYIDVTQMDKIIETAKLNERYRVILFAQSKDRSAESINKKIYAVKTYLRLRGIDSERILVLPIQDEKGGEEVKLVVVDTVD
jgi:hypothetical protein